MNKREIFLSIINPFDNKVSRWLVNRELSSRKLTIVRQSGSEVVDNRGVGNLVIFADKKMELLSLRQIKKPD